MRGRFQRVHFVGAGGVGMSGIAEVMVNLGYDVTGSDIAAGEAVRRLNAIGAQISIGHSQANVGDAQVVVYSSAVEEDNVELRRARELKIPVIPRAEMLAELMRMKYSVAVSGSHGKTSVTSMAATVLSSAGLDPTIVVGGRLAMYDSTAKLGGGEYLVAEADESDRSFLKLLPTLAVVTSIDCEHLDTYRDLADIQDAFAQFVNAVPFYGAGILCADERSIQAILPRLHRRIITYGFSPQADVQARRPKVVGFDSSFELYWHGDAVGPATLPAPGRHHILNALAALAVGLELELDSETMIASLAKFRNADRRMQLLGEAGGVMIFDDYGHHPTEISLTLATLKEAWGRRVVCVFQPHRFSRAQALMEEFWHSFNDADVLVVTDIYAAGEKPIAGLTGEQLADGIKAYGHRDVIYIDDLKDIPAYVMEQLQPDDILISLGAGDVWRVAQATLRMLRQEGAPV